MEYTGYVLLRSKSASIASRWLDELGEVFEGLADMPKQYRVIEEQAYIEIEIRQLLYHSHRVLFHVDDDALVVHILRIYHGARSALAPDELTET